MRPRLFELARGEAAFLALAAAHHARCLRDPELIVRFLTLKGKVGEPTSLAHQYYSLRLAQLGEMSTRNRIDTTARATAARKNRPVDGSRGAAWGRQIGFRCSAR